MEIKFICLAVVFAFIICGMWYCIKGLGEEQAKARKECDECLGTIGILFNHSYKGLNRNDTTKEIHFRVEQVIQFKDNSYGIKAFAVKSSGVVGYWIGHTQDFVDQVRDFDLTDCGEYHGG